MSAITYRVSPALSNDDLNLLFCSAWDGHTDRDFQPVLRHSLGWVAAYDAKDPLLANRLVGFVNLAWDGGIHAFLLDTTVHADYQRQGIGSELVAKATRHAWDSGIVWLHVDYEPHLEVFYRQCGFRPTNSGLMNLRNALIK